MSTGNANSIIKPSLLDTAVVKNLEGLKSEKQKVIEERRRNVRFEVLFYLKHKLPHGNVDLELVNSLPEKEFDRLLNKSRFSRFWRILWPGIIGSLGYYFMIIHPTESPLLIVPSVFASMLFGTLFLGRLLGFDDFGDNEMRNGL